MRILTADEIRKVECKCFELYSTEADLMLRAGTECFNAIVKKYGDKLKKSSISVLCGNGKNAGDGFVIARLLCSYGADAKIVLCDKSPSIDEPLMYYNQAIDSGVKSEYFTDINSDFVVDCMFGIGFHGEARAPFDKIFKAVNDSTAIVISVDTPSGTNATTGETCQACIRADFTIAISTLKYAHVLPPSNAMCGDICVVNIGIPNDCYEDSYCETIELDSVKSLLPKADKNANKGTFGHQLNLCGSYTMPGAGVICAKAAIRTGAGLVKVTVPKSAYPIIASHLVQPIFNPVAQNEMGTYSVNAIDDILKDVEWASSIVIGCGIGCNSDTREITRNVLLNAKSPIIIDADGINSIISCIDIIKEIKVPVVLTPHPGEMSRLVSKTIAEVQANRIDCAKEFANEYGCIVALKGANTVVTDGKTVFVNTTGNPAMAMGGTGDMLSGMIGSFVAQGIALFDAVKIGVYIHGLCGDIASSRLSKRGLTVCDMIEQLGTLMSEFE